MSFFCNWCGELVFHIITIYDKDNRPIWFGCFRCYCKKRELDNHVAEPQ